MSNILGKLLNKKSQNIPKHIQKIQEAKEQHLKELDLSWNSRYGSLTWIPAEVFELEQLEALNLSGNSLTEIPDAIARLTNLTSLYVSGNQLTTLPETVGSLTSLTSLDLSGNRLTILPEGIGLLTNLISLDVSYNQLVALLVTLPEGIGLLTNLISLDVSYNQLVALPKGIDSLTNLASLNVRSNRLVALPKGIGSLTNLTSLNFSGIGLTTLPKAIGSLTNLISLDIRHNTLTTLPEAIGSLTNLTSLNLSHNQLTTLPEVIGSLTNLSSLYVNDNQLTTLPEAIGSLTNLRLLYVNDNQLTTLPEAIGSLTNLLLLDVSNNQLTTLPKTIGLLTSLRLLDLSSNQLTTLPEAIASLTDLMLLNVGESSVKIPPPEIVTRGVNAIKDYFRQKQAEGVDHIYEAKLLIVGEAGAGKTTLAKKIEHSDYQLQEHETSTEGIDVITWEFPLPDYIQKQHDQKTFRVNIWDFGGQEIYHATHQFFLTKRSLYTLVVDTRKEDTDFYYWLNVVELLSDSSPLLIIKNEKQDRHREINERQLRGQFTNLEKTLATNLSTNRGFEDIVDQIKHYISHLPHVGAELPKTWTRVREALERNARNYISLDKYLDLCTQQGFKLHEDKLQLSGYLHDLGVCLHFQDDALLNKTVILRPEWGTDAVYKVLDNKHVIRNLGKFNKAELAEIWNEDQYAGMHDELLHLMMKFQLCYKIPGTTDTYISPQLLSENQPKYNWPEENNLLLRYSYEFMPKGILTRFIVITHKLIYKQKLVWKSGVILKKDDTLAEVVEYYGKREIRIRIAGKHKKDLLTIVTHELDKIHDSFNRLKFTKLIPCNCETCKNSQEPHFYSYKVLREFVANKHYSIQCQQKPFAMVNVLGLIDDIVDRGLFFPSKPAEESITSFRWLHLTDLHRGMKEHDWLWPNVRDRVFEDLEKLYVKTGPWDLMLFTGDMTQQGSKEEFKNVDMLLEELLWHIHGLGSSPVLVTVPGNHDLVRPNPRRAAVKMLQQWNDHPDIQEDFWEDKKSEYREVVTRAFTNYASWWQRRAQKIHGVQHGLLPGDFSVTIEKDGVKLGILGLNSSFLQLTADDYAGKLALHVRQFHVACGGNGVDWAKEHYACILLMHHPPKWLDAASRQLLFGEIASHGRFVVHVCGHLHDARSLEISEAGTETRRLWQGRSLFGLEYFGGHQERLHGYTVGSLDIGTTTGSLRFWPREARLQGNERNIVPDMSLALTDDQHTPPSVFKLLRHCK